MVHSENSSAIDRAAAARSKSDEFSKCTILVIEIVSLLCLKPPKRWCTFWDPDSVHVTEKGRVVLHDLLVDREGVGHERLILCAVGEDYGAVLAEPQSAVMAMVAWMDMCPICW